MRGLAHEHAAEFLGIGRLAKQEPRLVGLSGGHARNEILLHDVAEVLQIGPARSRPDSGLHLARAGDRPFDRGNVRHRTVGSGKQRRERDG